jgi:vacuolar-type H+-ATPase subunit F/Vma7
MRVQLTLKSGNEKTGPIPVSMTERASCPNACPFKGTDENRKLRGCYAEGWPMRTHWDNVPSRGVDWSTFCEAISALPDNQLWRHNQAGDLPGDNDTLDGAMFAQLVLANRGKRGFTYTHKPGNREAIAMANRNGFTVNVSCDSLEQVDRESGKGYPLVVVIPMLEKGEVENKVTYTPAGNRVITCPAQWRNTSCAECKMCAVADRDYVVGFRAHGIAKRVTSNLVAPSSLNRKKVA